MLDEKIEQVNINASAWTPAFKYGIIWGLLSIIIELGQYLSGNLEKSMSGEDTTSSTVMFYFAISIAIFMIVKAIGDYKADRGGNITLGQSVGVGALTGLVYGIFIGVWSFIFYSFIFDGYADYVQFILDTVVEQWEQSGLNEDSIELYLGITETMMRPSFLAIISIPLFVIYASILAFVAGIFMKTD